MSNYDFETVVNRTGVGSFKWDEIVNTLGRVPEGVIPFSLADMEFTTQPELVQGLKDYLDHSVLGYATPTQAYKDAVKGWFKRRHGWDLDTEWLQDIHGVIAAFFTAVKAFTKPGEGVLLLTPVYYPMYMAATRNDRVLVESPLIREGDTYRIDFEDFEAKAKEENTKLFILCSPHNPSGRVWTRGELERIGRICIDNDVLIVSDEIHCDLLTPGQTHVPFASISEEFAGHSIICTAPSKSFNVAGLQTSNVVIKNPELRERYRTEMRRDDGNPKCNLLGLEGCRIVYTQCEPWLDQVLQIIDANRRLIIDFMAKELPKIQVMRLEGTYLLWLDFNGLGIECHELARILKEDAYLFLDEGFIFGKAGEGFERWNLACPTKYILPALERMKAALAKYC